MLIGCDTLGVQDVDGALVEGLGVEDTSDEGLESGDSGVEDTPRVGLQVHGARSSRGHILWSKEHDERRSEDSDSDDDRLISDVADSDDTVVTDEQFGIGSLSLQELATVERAAAVAAQFAPVVGHRRSGGAQDISVSTVGGLFREAVESSAVSYGTREAQGWAAGFTFEKEMRERDAELLLFHKGDFVAMCNARRDEGAADRLSVERVQRLVQQEDLTDKLDFDRLIRIAQGVIIHTPVGFIPSGFDNRPPLRRKYEREVSQTVNKLLSEQWDKNTVMLLPTEMISYLRGIHFSPIHWVLKVGKPQGRVIGDTSNPAEGSEALNGTGKAGKEAVRAAIQAEWGRIKHPTLSDLARMIMVMVRKHGAHNLRLWKMDLAGAFNLMDFEAKSAMLLAFELTEGMTAIHTTGMFGWTGTPYVFQVITRVVQDLCRKHLKGLMAMYVDDMLGVSHVNALKQDMATVDGLARGLLGPNAVASEKTEHDVAQDWIGWHFDLNSLTVCASRRNLLKAVHAFFFLDVDGPVSLSQVERMASYASRYSILCPQMRPYTSALHGCKRAYGGDHNVRHDLSAAARCDVVMWRAYLSLLRFDPANFSRSLLSFRVRRSMVEIEYDASLTGIGVLVRVWSEATERFELICYTSLLVPWVAPDSSYQNTHEYLGVLVGLLLIRQERIFPDGFAFSIIGDSVSSLSWCSKGRAVSNLARSANVGHGLLAVDMDATIVSTTHIAGKDNDICDGLSRGKTGPEVGLPLELFVKLPADSLARQYVGLCDPHRAVVTADQHVHLSRSFLELLEPPEPSL